MQAKSLPNPLETRAVYLLESLPLPSLHFLLKFEFLFCSKSYL